MVVRIGSLVIMVVCSWFFIGCAANAVGSTDASVRDASVRDASVRDDGSTMTDGDTALDSGPDDDGGEWGEERCNGVDDDGDMIIDEGEADVLCPVANGASACVAGSCVPFRCDHGWADCDAIAENGCETAAFGDAACDMCITSCGSGTTCLGGLCRALPVQLTARIAHTAVLRADGTVVGWGDNRVGQLGDGTTSDRTSPVAATGLAAVVQVDTGESGSCAVVASGQVWCWGHNFITRTTTEISTVPVAIAVEDAIQVSVGGAHACALRRGGEVVCWGANSQGQTGSPSSTSNEPADVAGLTGASQLSLGTAHSCALLSGGGVVCWGNNQYGQLGDETFASRPTFAPVIGLTGIVQITSGERHSCALSSAGTALCWGRGTEGQLGDGVLENRSRPWAVPGVTASEVRAGDDHTCARSTTGAVWCWGRNSRGQLGDGTTTDALAPVLVADLTDAAALALGRQHSCARSRSRGVLCWGNNTNGQLGTGDRVQQSRPTPVVGLP